jgi:hypothetical protein
MKNRSRYPANWEQISLHVRKSAGFRCEECDRPCRHPGESWFDFVARLRESARDCHRWVRETYEEVADEESGEWGYVPKPTRFTLTTAHLDRDPANCDRANLKALCAPCHLRYDAMDNARRRAETRSRKRAEDDRAIGQTRLFE